jgi:Domain of unknown function (DUF6799)
MKKLLVICSALAFLTACNGSSSSKTGTETDTAYEKMSPDSTVETPPMRPTMLSETPDGIMMMKDGKMMIMNGGTWILMDSTITCTDGCKVMSTGEVIMKDGKKMKLTGGMSIDKDGNMIDDKGMKMNNKMMNEKK